MGPFVVIPLFPKSHVAATNVIIPPQASTTSTMMIKAAVPTGCGQPLVGRLRRAGGSAGSGNSGGGGFAVNR